MDLSTALTIPLFLYGIFLLIILIEYLTDRFGWFRKSSRVSPLSEEEREGVFSVSLSASESAAGAPESPAAQLEDLEAEQKKKKKKQVDQPPREWTEEQFE